MKNILHIIETLDTGGAENLLVKTIPGLQPGFKHTIVYLKKPDPLLPFLKGYDVIFLDYKGRFSFPAIVWQLRKIITERSIDIVHAHLFLPTMLARLACPGKIKLIFHIHSILSDDAFKHNSIARLAEKLTYSASHTAVFVSETVKQDYETSVGIKGKSYVLYNFVDNIFFSANPPSLIPENAPIKLVAVGNLRLQKNYEVIIQAFKQLKDLPVTLDIFGRGSLEEYLKNQLDQYGIKNITLKGFDSDIAAKLPDYHVFIAASENEGFCIAVAEAMTVGLPCVLSNIKTFQEITLGNAVFFNPTNEHSLVQVIKNLPANQDQLAKNAKILANRADTFRRDNFINKLKAIYNEVTVNDKPKART